MTEAVHKAKIAVFQYNWSLQAYSRDLVVKLSESGFDVDLFINRSCLKRNLINITALQNTPGVTLHFCEINPAADRIFSAVNRVLCWLPQALRKLWEPEPGIFRTIRFDAFLAAHTVMEKDLSRYICLIGIEKRGFLLAGMLASRFDLPLVYYSLELYVEGHPEMRHYTKIRPLEKKFHGVADATIIQDRYRAEVLCRSNNVSGGTLLLMPVAVRGVPTMQRSDFFHKKFGLTAGTKVILYFGRITRGRYYPELVDAARRLAPDQVLVFHGYGNRKLIAQLQANALHGNVFFSLDVVDEGQIPELIRSADIGIALYDNRIVNERLTAYSSQKIAQYLQAGVPIIAFSNESYLDLQERFRCCALIETPDDLPRAVSDILDNYDSYRSEAYRAFRECYNFDHAFLPLTDYFHRLAQKKCLHAPDNNQALPQRLPSDL